MADPVANGAEPAPSELEEIQMQMNAVTDEVSYSPFPIVCLQSTDMLHSLDRRRYLVNGSVTFSFLSPRGEF